MKGHFRMGERLEAPVLHLDTVQFLPGWEVRPLPEKQRLVEEFLDGHGAWVIDGNYTKLSQERRLLEADRIVLLRFGRLTRLRRVWRRYRRYKGRGRPDMTEGCNEKLDREFVRWVLWKGCDREKQRGLDAIAAQYPEKTVVLRNQRELDAFRRQLADG